MTRALRVAVLAAAAACLGGCYGQVHRSITIESEPAGAVCWLNDNEVGRTPVTVPFTWYGTYGVRLEHAGYEPFDGEAKVAAPWYEWIPIDLAAETVVPGVKHDDHRFAFTMTPSEPVDPAEVRQRAEAFRAEAIEPLP